MQLFDENGNPLNVATFMSEDLDGDGRANIPYPWFNGEKRLFNVFPLPEREQPAWRVETFPNAWTSTNPPALPTPPLAVVPPAGLPLAEADPAAEEEPEADAAEPDGTATDETSDETSGETSDSAGGDAQRDSEKPSGR